MKLSLHNDNFDEQSNCSKFADLCLQSLSLFLRYMVWSYSLFQIVKCFSYQWIKVWVIWVVLKLRKILFFLFISECYQHFLDTL